MARPFSRMNNSSSSFSSIEIEELGSFRSGLSNHVEDDGKTFIAVGENFKENKNNLTWAVQFFGAREVVLVHVHCPEKYISMMGAKFPVSQVAPEQLKIERLKEHRQMHKKLDKYIDACNAAKVKAEKLVIEMDDIAMGIVELISKHQITGLIMGAAADRYFQVGMKVQRSRKATFVRNEAPSTCKIWFVCKGALICTRESLPGTSPSPSTKFSNSEPGPSKSSRRQTMLTNPVQDLIMSVIRSPKAKPSHESSSVSRAYSVNPDEWERNQRNSPESYPSSWSETDDASNFGSSLRLKDDCSQDGSMSMLSYSVQSERQFNPPSLQDEPLEDHHLINNQQDGLEEADDEMFNKLREALTEVDNYKHQAYQESCKRSTAERVAVEARQKVKNLEIQYSAKLKEREELKESIARLTMEVQGIRTERDEARKELTSTLELKSQLESHLDAYSSSTKDLEGKLSVAQQLLSSVQSERDQTYEELKKACLLTSHLEAQLDSHVSSVRELEEKLSSAHELLDSLQNERDMLQQELDGAVQVAEVYRRREQNPNQSFANFLDFSFDEIEEATQGFADSQKIGEGGYGSVYRGFLRHTTVAVKVLRPQNWQGISEFHQEVEVLSKVRHPNLVTLIGACSKNRALVYEYLPNGSLEHHLKQGNDAQQPLSWQSRIRIAAEICSALIFLHSSKPQSVVHGDLKPANILLDANLTSKLSDFGISRLLPESATSHTLYCQTGPKGTLVYMDPEFLITGELTMQSDVYSLGIILLRLLTGKLPFGIVREVKEALAKERLKSILDPSAGEWPFIQAQQLTDIALRCCEMSRKLRPDLESEVWKVIAPMMRPLLNGAPSFSIGPNAESNNPVPPYFVCPIFQEIMKDPQVASDGYTYEGEAIRGWFEGGHKTSPMTNLVLPNIQLIPNLALRSAIKEWQENHGQS